MLLFLKDLSLECISLKDVKALSLVGIETVPQLLNYFPKRYEDRTNIPAFPSHSTSVSQCFKGQVVDLNTKIYSNNYKCQQVVIVDSMGGMFGSTNITCRWFNDSMIWNRFAVGQTVFLYGKVKEIGGKLVIDHPIVEVIDDDERAFIHIDRIVPIYRAIRGITQKKLRIIIYKLLNTLDPKSLDTFGSLDCFTNRVESFRELHFPDSFEKLVSVKDAFFFENQFVIQLNIAWRRICNGTKQGRILGRHTQMLRRLHLNLPFELTNAQKRCIKEIIQDMRLPKPMNRLLHGDVGAGKTFVAMAAMLLAVESGCQAALMAPTQILAEQHYLTFSKWLSPIGVSVALVTSQHDTTHLFNTEEKPDILIGTHALLYKPLLFDDLGFVVIDEQHKFGVAQRSALVNQGVTPDVLVMTATPIPRTLLLTAYGDLEVSVLDEKPSGRMPVITALRVTPKQIDVTKFVKDQVSNGRQVYLVYPLVEESATLKVESATQAFKKWGKRLSAYKVGLLHGQMDSCEKESIMNDFREGRIHVLVATTVIEVGVDVPNANLMIIFHAERFGLAQLHQLRGRVGRGNHKGYCIMITGSNNSEALEKLDVLVKNSDGFIIAEEDLRLRGPGDVLGTLQSGLMDTKFSATCSDVAVIVRAKELAGQVLFSDPKLDGIHSSLRSLLSESTLRQDFPHMA